MITPHPPVYLSGESFKVMKQDMAGGRSGGQTEPGGLSEDGAGSLESLRWCHTGVPEVGELLSGNPPESFSPVIS